MHPNTFARRVLAGLAVLAGIVGGSALAQPPAGGAPQVPPPPDIKPDAKTGALVVPLGGAVRFKPSEKNIVDVLVQNEDILGVRFGPPDPKTLILTGRVVGATVITVTFEDKTRSRYDVLVQPDFALLRNVIRQAVPTANVDVLPGVGNVVILTGFVTRAEDLDAVQRIASSAVGGNTQNVISTVQIGGSHHVLIDVTVAQVDRTELRERGFVFGINGSTVGFASVLGGLASSNIGVGGGAAGGFGILPGAGSNIVVGIVPSNTLIGLRALRTEGIAKFLSEPKVITQTGRPAILRSGGQQAVLGPAAGINGPGVVLEEVGTTLEVLPVVFGNGKIYLEVQPQFRSVNNGRGVTTAFGFTPGFNQQSTRSSVLMESGQTFAIGGLLETEVQAQAQKVPVLGDLPLLGFAFSSVSHQERETELLILVTPRLVEALDCNQVPRRVPGRETRSADDYELFVESLLEAPRGQRQPWKGVRYNAAYKCDPTIGCFPCADALCGANGIGTRIGHGGGCSTAGGCATGGGLITKTATMPATLPPSLMPDAPVTPVVPVIPTGGDPMPEK